MKKLIILFCLPVVISFTQNLVPNPGFEVQTSCPLVSEIDKAVPWNTASNATPDLFNTTCPTQNTSGNSGIGSSGVYIQNSLTNYREYIKVELDSTLIANNTYCVEFYVKAVPFKYTSDDIGLAFSSTEPSYNQSTNINITPDVINQTGVIANSWTKVEGEYLANGGEKWITIGNFNDDSNVTAEILNSSSNFESIYFNIDDVSITVCNTSDTTTTPIDTTITPIDTITNVGIQRLSLDEVIVFPNPFNNFLNIEAHQMISSVSVFNVFGQLVLLKNEVNNNSIQIELVDCKKGAYVLILNFADGKKGFQSIVKN
jgi:hypothetical protein